MSLVILKSLLTFNVGAVITCGFKGVERERMRERNTRRIKGKWECSPVRVALKKVLFIFLVLCFSVQSAQPQKNTFVVIAHPSVAIEQLNLFQLRKIFSMKQTNWPGGQGVKVFVLNSKSTIHLNFCKSLLKMFPYQLDQIWNKLTYSGLGDPPVTVDSMEEMLERVSQTPGAIGYLNADIPPKDVVTIKVGKG